MTENFLNVEINPLIPKPHNVGRYQDRLSEIKEEFESKRTTTLSKGSLHEAMSKDLSERKERSRVYVQPENSMMVINPYLFAVSANELSI